MSGYRGCKTAQQGIKSSSKRPGLYRVSRENRREISNICCKRFQATPLDPPPQGPLPNDRVQGRTAFEVVVVDFADLIYYKRSSGRQDKAYLALFSCSLIRAVHLEILPNLETSTFIPCFKWFVARRGRPRKMYSDNGGTFVKAAKWIETVRKDELLQGYLHDQEIQWQFNMSRYPGGVLNLNASSGWLSKHCIRQLVVLNSLSTN